MYAVVEIRGKQYRIAKDMKVKIPFINLEAGKKVEFDRVLMLEDDKGNIIWGNPVIKDQLVNATILNHGREKKIIVFKKKRRKGYKKKNGHRQDYTMIEIEDIKSGKAKTVSAAEKQTAEAPKIKSKEQEKVSAKEQKATAAVKTAPKPKVTKPGVKKEEKIKTAKKKETGIKKAAEKKKSTKVQAAKKTAAKSKTKAAPKKK
jgi:large subunit ribosomal protein L21